MARLCILCTQVEAAHPNVGGGYLPHPFEPADMIRRKSYSGPNRRKVVRRKADREAA